MWLPRECSTAGKPTHHDSKLSTYLFLRQNDPVLHFHGLNLDCSPRRVAHYGSAINHHVSDHANSGGQRCKLIRSSTEQQTGTDHVSHLLHRSLRRSMGWSRPSKQLILVFKASATSSAASLPT